MLRRCPDPVAPPCPQAFGRAAERCDPGSCGATQRNPAAARAGGIRDHRVLIRQRNGKPSQLMLLTLLRTYLRPYGRPITVLVLLHLAATIASLMLPSLNADIIDNGIILGDIPYILRQGGWMLAVSLIHVTCTVLAVFLGARTAMAFGRDVRSAVFRQVASFSRREVAEFGAPSLITRNTNDVQQVQMFTVMGFNMLVMAPIMMVGGVIMALRENAGLAWLVAVAVPLLGVAIAIIISRLVPAFRRLQERIDRVNEVMREQLIGVRVIRAFVREEHEKQRFARANRDLTDVALYVGRWMALFFPVVMLVFSLSNVAVIWFGGLRIDAGLMEIGSLTAFLAYLIQILMAVMMSTFIFMMLPRAAVSADRIGAVLNTSFSVVPPAEGKSAPAQGVLRFEDVSFRYPSASHPVLEDISFAAAAGQTIAVIGPTGAGKSTLMHLIPRLFDATGGTVRVDGIDVRDFHPDALCARTRFVPTTAYLFSGTIAENLRYGRPEASEAEMWEALEIAQARDFVTALPEQLEAPVAQGGTNFSGGQRQRLAIARSIIKKPSIYLFDDSFSALDMSTDARLRAALGPVTRSSIVLINAQRIATIEDADLILVLEDGRIVARGTHEELLASSPVYQEIVESQQLVEA